MAANKKIIVISVCVVLLVALVAAAVVATTHRKTLAASPAPKGSTELSTTVKAVKAICQQIEYEETCKRSLTEAAGNITDLKELIKVGFKVTVKEIGDVLNKSTALQKAAKDPSTKDAYEVCKEVLDSAINNIQHSIDNFDLSDISSLDDHVFDLKTWIASAITCHETCLDSFENTTGNTAQEMKKLLKTSKELTINSYEMVKEISKVFSTFQVPGFSRRLLSSRALPSWVKGGKRHLLQANSATIKPDVVVAQDGTGKYKTINEALKEAPMKGTKPFVIHIKAGVYAEYVYIPKKMNYIVFIGDGPSKTKITGNKSYAQGVKTFKTATVAVDGWYFVAKDIGFENTAGSVGHQAVALRVSSDEALIYNCQINGYQDTLYAHDGRQFYRDCTISGTIDFIFGDAEAVFQNCKMVIRRPGENQDCMVTAQGRTQAVMHTGTVLQNCVVTAEPAFSDPTKPKLKAYLGRPWKAFSRTVVLNSEIDSVIEPGGWAPWSGNMYLDTCWYAEYGNKGPGADMSKRVPWLKKTNGPEQLGDFVPEKFLRGGWHDLLKKMGYGNDGGRKKKAAIIGLSSILLVAMVVAVAVGVTRNKSQSSGNNAPAGNGQVSTSNKAITAICQPTDYKDACVSSLSAAKNTTDPKELIKVSFQAAVKNITDASKNTSVLQEAAKDPKTSHAFENCQELLGIAVDDLKRSFDKVGSFDVSKLDDYVDDLKTWLSGVITYQETCLDGFENITGDAGEKMKKLLKTSGELSSNGLAMVSELSKLLKSFQIPNLSRRLLQETSDDEVPSWADAGRRRLLQANLNSLKPNAVVAQDGSGKFRTINDALKAAPPPKSNQTYVILIKAGVYKEYIEIPRHQNDIVFIGEGADKTRITGNKNFVDGIGTYKTATVAVMGDRFFARDIGFENSAGPTKHQAVALRVSADKSIFYRCNMDGYQDTLYTHTYRQFYRDCKITGTIDFIFGDAAAIFQNCKMVVRKPLENQACMVTAQGRKDQRSTGIIVLQNCYITAEPAFLAVKPAIASYLGRPWKEFSRTIVMQSFIDTNIVPEGWSPWAGTYALDTCYYAEFSNRGPGANQAKRVTWKGIKKISAQEAEGYTPRNRFTTRDGRPRPYLQKMSNDREDPANKFHTLQPLRDLESNWAVDLAKNLEEYLLKICSGEITGEIDDGGRLSVNFAEAALLLQGSIQVYSRKVEYLYSLVLHALEFISEKK
ncbi:hypothetical protein RJ639_002744, partial [Escallonia herrerae]